MLKHLIRRTRQLIPFIAAAVAVVPLPAFAIPQKVDTGLVGCELNDLATSSNAGVTLAACSGPFGLYYSTDFASNWNRAQGGAYVAGMGRKLGINSTRAFALVGRPGTIYTDTLAHLESATPAWTALSLTEVATMRVDENFVVSSNYSGVVTATRISDFTTQDSSTISGANDVLGISISSAQGFVFVVAETTPGSRLLFRATFNPTTGDLGSFSDITSNIGVPNGKVGTVNISPIGQVYVSISPTFGSSQTFVSVDNGVGFSSVPDVDNFVNDADFSADGTVQIIGNNVSTDSGATFPVSLSRTGDDPGLQNGVVLMNPTNPAVALVKSGLGIARTGDLTSSNPSFSDSNSGIRSANVKDIAQLAADKNRIALGLDTGVAYSENFLSASPTFRGYCPAGSCLSAKVSLDPSDSSVIFAGGAPVYRGTSSNGSVTWEVLIDSLSAILRVGAMRVLESDPSKLVVGYYEVSGENAGALRFYNKANVTQFSEPLTKQINAFVEVNGSLMFAAVGRKLQRTPTSDTRGIWRSSNGGASFSQESDPDFASLLLVNDFAYDQVNDILYAASANSNTEGEMGSGNGTIYRLLNAAAGNTDWSKTPGTFFAADSGSDESFSTVAVDPATGHVYVGAQTKIWVSTNRGLSWVLYYDGEEGEDIAKLTYDDLVSAGPGGFQGYTGEPPRCQGNKADLTQDIKRKVTKRAVFARAVGALSSTPAALESITLQVKKGKTFQTMQTKATASNGKVTFKVPNRRATYRLVDSFAQTMCNVKEKKTKSRR